MVLVAYACGMELRLANSQSLVVDTVSALKPEQRKNVLVAFHIRRSWKRLSIDSDLSRFDGKILDIVVLDKQGTTIGLVIL